MRLAAIDVGTNTTRLLVVENTAEGHRDLDRRLLFTRLGGGVDAEETISAEAIRRTLGAVAEFCAVCGDFGVGQLRIAGTSALRDASNREEFLRGVRELAGVEPEVLSGGEEARLSFLGVTSDLPPGRWLVCDIGGGSTEFVLGTSGDEPEVRLSLDVGSVRLTERFLRSDPLAAEELLLMEAAVDDALEKAARDLSGAGGARLVGVAGTVTSLAAVHLGLRAYDPARTHHLRLSRSSVDLLYHRLASMSLDERLEIPSLPEGRADVIVAGASILVRAMEKWSFEEVTVSEEDILDGLVLEMLGEGRKSGGAQEK